MFDQDRRSKPMHPFQFIHAPEPPILTPIRNLPASHTYSTLATPSAPTDVAEQTIQPFPSTAGFASVDAAAASGASAPHHHPFHPPQPIAASTLPPPLSPTSTSLSGSAARNKSEMELTNIEDETVDADDHDGGARGRRRRWVKHERRMKRAELDDTDMEASIDIEMQDDEPMGGMNI